MPRTSYLVPQYPVPRALCSVPYNHPIADHCSLLACPARIDSMCGCPCILRDALSQATNRLPPVPLQSVYWRGFCQDASIASTCPLVPAEIWKRLPQVRVCLRAYLDVSRFPAPAHISSLNSLNSGHPSSV